jgi:hypothetical protein
VGLEQGGRNRTTCGDAPSKDGKNVDILMDPSTATSRRFAGRMSTTTRRFLGTMTQTVCRWLSLRQDEGIMALRRLKKQMKKPEVLLLPPVRGDEA